VIRVNDDVGDVMETHEYKEISKNGEQKAVQEFFQNVLDVLKQNSVSNII